VGEAGGGIVRRRPETTTAVQDSDEWRRSGDVAGMMVDRDLDRLPVVGKPRRSAGIVSSTDVIALDEVRAGWVERRAGRRRGVAGS
jgi:hypothetical protein